MNSKHDAQKAYKNFRMTHGLHFKVQLLAAMRKQTMIDALDDTVSEALRTQQRRKSMITFISSQPSLEELEAMASALDLDIQDVKYALQKETTELYQLSERAPYASGSAMQSWGGSVDGTEAATWWGGDGFYGCLQGITEGNAYEGEDRGPFDTRSEALDALKADYEQEDDEEDYVEFEEDEDPQEEPEGE